MKHAFVTRVGGAAAVALLLGACTMKSEEVPPLTGPSEMGLSVGVTVAPDILTQDGASQSVVTVTTRDVNGQPVRNVSMRAELLVGGSLVDFGSLSARNIVSDADGRATLVYTAPPAPSVAPDNFTVVEIMVTPMGTNFGNSLPRFASVRLVPPGVIVPPDGLAPYFTFNPSGPDDNETVLFEACGDPDRECSPSNNPIASYSWNFGDGSSGSGRTATHSFRDPGTYAVELTVTDFVDRSASTTQIVTVGAGFAPVAAFTFSPLEPIPGQAVNFNASASAAAPDRRIVRWRWDFGDGTTASGERVNHTYSQVGDYNVTLVVEDDAGREGVVTQTVSIGSDAPTADFTFSPGTPTAGTPVNFNPAASTVASGRTIASYAWTFGDGTSSTAATPSKTYLLPGSYNVTLTITDSQGRTGTVTKTVTVS
jgi:PKD repeat protein